MVASFVHGGLFDLWFFSLGTTLDRCMPTVWRIVGVLSVSLFAASFVVLCKNLRGTPKPPRKLGTHRVKASGSRISSKKGRKKRSSTNTEHSEDVKLNGVAAESEGQQNAEEEDVKVSGVAADSEGQQDVEEEGMEVEIEMEYALRSEENKHESAEQDELHEQETVREENLLENREPETKELVRICDVELVIPGEDRTRARGVHHAFVDFLDLECNTATECQAVRIRDKAEDECDVQVEAGAKADPGPYTLVQSKLQSAPGSRPSVCLQPRRSPPRTAKGPPPQHLLAGLQFAARRAARAAAPHRAAAPPMAAAPHRAAAPPMAAAPLMGTLDLAHKPLQSQSKVFGRPMKRLTVEEMIQKRTSMMNRAGRVPGPALKQHICTALPFAHASCDPCATTAPEVA